MHMWAPEEEGYGCECEQLVVVPSRKSVLIMNSRLPTSSDLPAERKLGGLKTSWKPLLGTSHFPGSWQDAGWKGGSNPPAPAGKRQFFYSMLLFLVAWK